MIIDKALKNLIEKLNIPDLVNILNLDDNNQQKVFVLGFYRLQNGSYHKRKNFDDQINFFKKDYNKVKKINIHPDLWKSVKAILNKGFKEKYKVDFYTQFTSTNVRKRIMLDFMKNKLNYESISDDIDSRIQNWEEKKKKKK